MLNYSKSGNYHKHYSMIKQYRFLFFELPMILMQFVVSVAPKKNAGFRKSLKPCRMDKINNEEKPYNDNTQSKQ